MRQSRQEKHEAGHWLGSDWSVLREWPKSAKAGQAENGRLRPNYRPRARSKPHRSDRETSAIQQERLTAWGGVANGISVVDTEIPDAASTRTLLAKFGDWDSLIGSRGLAFLPSRPCFGRLV